MAGEFRILLFREVFSILFYLLMWCVDRIERVKEIGVAGIKDFSFIKCLHCHYAHFLARPEHNNVVGKWVHEKLIEKQLISG